MVVKKQKGFPIKRLSLLTALAITGIIWYDVNQNGSWSDSRTLNALQQYGICEYAHKAVDKARSGLTWMDANIENIFPGYHKTVADFSEPYINLILDLSKIVRNGFYNVQTLVMEKYPVMVQSIESYAPGLIEQSQTAFGDVYSTSVHYFSSSVDYLKKEVFVGQFSPDNVQRVVIEAFNTTQQKATEYYHWIYEKVQTSIK